MSPLKQPQGWRYVRSRLRLLNRPQVLGTVALLLVSGAVLNQSWRRPSVAPSAPSSLPADATPFSPSDPLSTLEPPSIDLPAETNRAPSRSEAIALPSPTPTADLDSSPSSTLPSPTAQRQNSPSVPALQTSPIDRPASGASSVPELNLAPASPAPSADPLRSAIAGQSSRQPLPSAQPRSPSDWVSPYVTSPPPGTTGYTLPPTLSPSPSGLPAARPEVGGLNTPPGFGVAPAPAITPSLPTAPEPQFAPSQPIGNGQINTFGNP